MYDEYKDQYLVFSNLLNDSLKFDGNNGIYSIKFASIIEPTSILIIKSGKQKCYVLNRNTDLKEITQCVLDFMNIQNATNRTKVLLLKSLFVEIDNSMSSDEY